MEHHSYYGQDAPESDLNPEKSWSQLTALHLLTQMGWEYVSPEQCLDLRNGQLDQVLLESILTDFLRRKSSYEFKGSVRLFTENAVQSAVQALKGIRVTGDILQNSQMYDLLCLGTGTPQTVDGDTRSYVMNYIDWQDPENNLYHFTRDFRLECLDHGSHVIIDIVLFVNGIPMCVMACRGSDDDPVNANPMDQAIDALGTLQTHERIPQLFVYSQILLALNRDATRYSTTGTKKQFWTVWKEDGIDAFINEMIRAPMDLGMAPELISRVMMSKTWRSMAGQNRDVVEQDRALYSLCRPGRFLDLIYRFILFDKGTKIIARYSQFFTVKNCINRLLGRPKGRPRGGTVLYAQGSGKSLTMVMLVKSLFLHSDLIHAHVVLVTDRMDLGDTLGSALRACGTDVEQVSTGKHLVALLRDQGRHVIMSPMHKFAKALSNRAIKHISRDTLVIMDEGHHPAQMIMAINGTRVIGFSGVPLAHMAEHDLFGYDRDLIPPAYTLSRAVEDKTVTPLLYEERHVTQGLDAKNLERWFKKMTSCLNTTWKDALAKTFIYEPSLCREYMNIRMIAWDISTHFATRYQGTGGKGQLVTPDKDTALLYKTFLDEFGFVNSTVLISHPWEREGEDNQEPSQQTLRFWEGMMARYGSEKKYHSQVVHGFQHEQFPDIIIVVDKLITTFHAPCNGVLYLARDLKEHTLLRALARVNQVFPGKEYGLVLDYRGAIHGQNKSLAFNGFMADISEKTADLPFLHSSVWELFSGINKSKDTEVYGVYLRNERLRRTFYTRFGHYARVLALALSSSTFLRSTPGKTLNLYKKDLSFFLNLRAVLSKRFQEKNDFSEYEPVINKLLDTHIEPGGSMQDYEPLHLLNTDERLNVFGDQGLSDPFKADMIAMATRNIILGHMEKDPAFYKKLSRRLEKVISGFHGNTINTVKALGSIKDIAEKVSTHVDEDLPPDLLAQPLARQFYGCLREPMAEYAGGNTRTGIDVALEVEKRILPFKTRNWKTNPDVINRIRREIDDILFEMVSTRRIELPVEEHDAIIERCIEISKENEK